MWLFWYINVWHGLRNNTKCHFLKSRYSIRYKYIYFIPLSPFGFVDWMNFIEAYVHHSLSCSPWYCFHKRCVDGGKVQSTGYIVHSVRHRDLEHTTHWNSTEHRMKMKERGKNETENCPYCNDTSESPTSTRWRCSKLQWPIASSHIAHRIYLYNCTRGSRIQPIPIWFLINTWNRIFLFIFFLCLFLFHQKRITFSVPHLCPKNPFIIIMDRVDVCY